MFTGPINSGMSGGPNLTVDGHVAGVNVSKRLDGELVSFLVPVRYVRALLDRVAQQKQAPADFKAVVGQQLLDHQAVMVDRVLEAPFTLRALGPYRVPVRESDQLRCWGWSNTKQDKPYAVDQMNCAMEAAIFVSEQLQTGRVTIRHQYIRSEELSALRFATLASNNFKNQNFGGHKDLRVTPPVCNESFVNNGSLPMRAVLCVSAYRKFAGLYDFGLLLATTDANHKTLHSRIDIDGVSYANGLRMAKLFGDAIQRGEAK